MSSNGLECNPLIGAFKLSSDSPRENIIESLLKFKTTFEESEQNVVTRFDNLEMKFAVISRLLRTMMT